MYSVGKAIVSGLLLTVLAAGLTAGPALAFQEAVAKSETSPADRLLQEVSKRAASLAAAPYAKPSADLPTAFQGLDYDGYRKLRARPETMVWGKAGNPFAVLPLPRGGLYHDEVAIHFVDATGQVQSHASPAFVDFVDFPQATDGQRAELGASGWRAITKPGQAGIGYEFAVFQGGTYFRAVGDGQIYGVSARALAIGAGSPQGEEFPRFTDFWIIEPANPGNRPGNGDESLTFIALADSPAAAAAYRFVLRPGSDATIDVVAEIHPRTDIAEPGLAPLSSMFLRGTADPHMKSDARAEVHDSDGLSILTATGEHIWRPLANPADRDHCIQYMTAVPLIFGRLVASDYDDAVASDPRIDQLRAKMRVVENPQFTKDYYDAEKRFIGNAVQVKFSDGTQTERRRAEGLPILEEKFRTSLAPRLGMERLAKLNDLCRDAKRLQATAVDEFLPRPAQRFGRDPQCASDAPPRHRPVPQSSHDGEEPPLLVGGLRDPGAEQLVHALLGDLAALAHMSERDRVASLWSGGVPSGFAEELDLVRVTLGQLDRVLQRRLRPADAQLLGRQPQRFDRGHVVEQPQLVEVRPLTEGRCVGHCAGQRGQACGYHRDRMALRRAVKVLQGDQQRSPIRLRRVLELIDEDRQASTITRPRQPASLFQAPLDQIARTARGAFGAELRPRNPDLDLDLVQRLQQSACLRQERAVPHLLRERPGKVTGHRRVVAAGHPHSQVVTGDSLALGGPQQRGLAESPRAVERQQRPPRAPQGIHSGQSVADHLEFMPPASQMDRQRPGRVRAGNHRQPPQIHPYRSPRTIQTDTHRLARVQGWPIADYSAE